MKVLNKNRYCYKCKCRKPIDNFKNSFKNKKGKLNSKSYCDDCTNIKFCVMCNLKKEVKFFKETNFHKYRHCKCDKCLNSIKHKFRQEINELRQQKIPITATTLKLKINQRALINFIKKTNQIIK